MKILAIETSCDETAIAIVEATGSEHDAQFHVLGNALLSQIELHREYGGVFPALAKREHAKNLVPILEAALEEAELLHEDTQAMSEETRDTIAALLEREPGLSARSCDTRRKSTTPSGSLPGGDVPTASKRFNASLMSGAPHSSTLWHPSTLP